MLRYFPLMIDTNHVSCMPIMKTAYIVAGSDPNAENHSKATPLMLAAGTGQLDVINLLLDAGVNINHVRGFSLILFFCVEIQCKVFFRPLLNSKNRLI